MNALHFKHSHTSRFDFVNGANDFGSRFLFSTRQISDRLQLLDRTANVLFDGKVKSFLKREIFADFFGGRLDFADKRTNLVRFLSQIRISLQSSRYGPAAFVPHHDHKFRFQVVNAILDTANDIGVDNIASNANDKQIPKALVEQQFRRNTRVTATENRSERGLPVDQTFSPIVGAMGMLKFSRNESSVAAEKSLDRVLGSLRWFFTSFGWSVSRVVLFFMVSLLPILSVLKEPFND